MKFDCFETTVEKSILASIENYEWCCKGEERKRTFVYKAKYLIWLFLLMIISPHKNVDSKKFVCTMTPVNEKRLHSYAENNEYYKFAKLNSTISKMKSNRSVFSRYSICSRLNIIFQGIQFFFRHYKLLKGYMHFTLEYYVIAQFVFDTQPKEIISPCMYDRYCTFLSYLGHYSDIKLIGVQDGAAVDIAVPAKIYCNVMYTFDEYEREIIKSFIANNDCEYICTGFVSTIKWKKYKKGNKQLIAIASQDWFTQKTLQLIEAVLREPESAMFDIIVYPHYREKSEQYTEICTKYPQIILCTNNRYENIDLLITFYSTIVYDFWSVNPKLNVMCLRIPGFEPGYYGRENVNVFDDMLEFINNLYGKF